MTVHVFTGPTASPTQVRSVLPDAEVHGPVGHGDLLRTDLRTGDTVVIIDGTFYRSPAIRHKEILQVLHHGITVIGAASTGAQRAAELDTLGMIGSGTVYRLYRNGTLDGDDEVAVLHGDADDGYRCVSEPLVDIRCTVARSWRRGVLSRASADALVDAAKNCWFGDRSITRLLQTTGQLSELERHRFAAFWRHHRSNITSSDAHRALRLASRLADAPHAAVRRPPPPRTWWLQEWLWTADHASTGGDDDPGVAHRDILTFAQIFASDYPAWYRAQVLDLARAEAETATGVRPDDGAQALRHLAIQRGLLDDTPGLMPPSGRLAALLLPAERQLDPTEQLVRAMIRCYRIGPSVPVPTLMTRIRRTPAYPRLVDMAAAAVRLNQDLADRHPSYVPGRIAPEKIVSILAGRWGLHAAGPLTAGLRDRGFAGTSEYVRSARPFAALALLDGVPAFELSATTTPTTPTAVPPERATDLVGA